MKKLLSLLALTLSVGAFAQERVVLTSKSTSIGTDSAIIVRTAATPDKVELTFQVPMANSICLESRVRVVPRTCSRTENVYSTRRVCRDVVVSTPTRPQGPTGPRYNPPTQTRRECHDERYVVSTRRIIYDCSYSESYCARYGTDVNRESDKVKIKFKDLPNLGGTEEETFKVVARQRSYDGENVVYDITPITTAEGREYEVKSKGILGFDSYVIQPK